VFLGGSFTVQRVPVTPKTLYHATYAQVCICSIDPPEGHQSQSSRYGAYLLSNICSKSGALDTPAAVLSTLMQMRDRASAHNAGMLYSVQQNAKNPSYVSVCISQ